MIGFYETRVRFPKYEGRWDMGWLPYPHTFNDGSAIQEEIRARILALLDTAEANHDEPEDSSSSAAPDGWVVLDEVLDVREAPPGP